MTSPCGWSASTSFASWRTARTGTRKHGTAWSSYTRSTALPSLSVPDIHPTATVYQGTVLGENVKVLEGAVVGKQPTLSPLDREARAALTDRDR